MITGRVNLISLLLAASYLLAANAFAAVVTTGVNVHSYASTNVTTSAYVTLVASTPYTTCKVVVQDTSTKIIKLAVGSAGNEVDLATAPVSGMYVLPTCVPASSRISAKAVDASATTGYNILSFLP